VISLHQEIKCTAGYFLKTMCWLDAFQETAMEHSNNVVNCSSTFQSF